MSFYTCQCSSDDQANVEPCAAIKMPDQQVRWAQASAGFRSAATYLIKAAMSTGEIDARSFMYVAIRLAELAFSDLRHDKVCLHGVIHYMTGGVTSQRYEA